MGRVDNKIALVTGGARGLGAETARLLSEEGATVIVVDLLESEGRAVADRIGGAFYPIDVSQEGDWQYLMESIESEFGALHILFNNAGITGLGQNLGPQDPEHATLESWRCIHHINLDSVFLGCKYGMGLMKATGGSIINMSSRSGMVGVSGAAAYASSKAGIRNHTKTVALYCAEAGYAIRCNSLHPGAVLTPLWDPMLGTQGAEREQMIANIANGIPLGNMGEPIDVAYAVLYLASDESKYITGAELVIDGGILAGSASEPRKK